MKIAVVIPALDESREIAGAVESASAPKREAGCRAGEAGSQDRHPGEIEASRKAEGSRQGEGSCEVEVWVVDGGSRDDTVERARAAGARVIPSPPGRARQLGAGCEASSADVVLFLHADTRLPSGWDEAIRRALERPDTIGGAFGLRFDRRGGLLRVVEWGARLRATILRLPYGDQAIFVRRKTLEALGGVPQVPLMEDLDLVRAMKSAGRLALLPLDVTTSARRYAEGGVLRTALRHAAALVAWRLGIDRARVSRWVRA